MTENVAIILAAGCGVRFGGSVPKQYLSFGKTMLLDQTIGVFISSDIFSKILIIVNPHHQKFYKQSIYYDKVFFIDGGNTRSQSVFNAIFFLNDCGIDINTILIHDGVRPYITNTLIKNVFDELIKYGVGHGVIPITLLCDTLRKHEDDKFIVLSRDNLYLTQTPQGFFFNDILAAYCDIDFSKDIACTDDAMIAESYGIIIKSIYGDINNYKITTAADYKSLI